MDFLGWIWVSVLILAIIIELLTDQLISIWFVPGAIVATIMDFCSAKPVWQILVFAIVSVAGIIIGQKCLNKYLTPKREKTNIDAIIGEKCVVTERIDNFAGCGLAKIKGQVWSARGVNENDVFEVGEVLNVVAIEGVKLICKK